jgi:hypothetical protein
MRARRQAGEEARRRVAAEEEFGDQRAARFRGRAPVRRVAKIGDRGEAGVTRDSHPRAAGLKVAAGEKIGMIGPPVRGLGGTLAPFVAIGRDHQRQVGARSPRDHDEAHGGPQPSVLILVRSAA